MSDSKIDIEELIVQNPKSYLEKLRDSAILPFNEFQEWKNIYYDIYKGFQIGFFNREDIKNPPKDYFKVFIYHSDPEKTRKNLIDNYEAINSRYYNLHMFIPIKNFEKLIDESFHHEAGDFVHLYELCLEPNIKWDLNLLRKFKKLSEHHHRESLWINSKVNIKLDFNIVEEFKDDIKWGDIILFKELKWTLPKLLKYKDYIKFEEYKKYSGTGVYKEAGFSLNLNTKWNVQTIQSLSEFWNWSELCLNRYINWDISLINRFIERVDFESLSSNPHLKWNTELIKSFKDKWNWQSLSGNPSLPWSLEFLKKYHQYLKWDVEFQCNYDSGNEVDEAEANFYPSISTNPGVPWYTEMIEYCKDKIDFWRLARRGKINLEVLKKIKNELYRKEHTGWVFHKSSDFSHTEKINVTGWENLAKNKLFKLSQDIVNYLNDNEIKLTYSVGNLARREGEYVTSTLKLIELFRNSAFVNEEYMKQVIQDDNLKIVFINNDFINDEIWDNIIVPYTLKNKKRLLNKFEKIKDLEET